MDPNQLLPGQVSQMSSNPVQDGKPYFMGGEALIRFSSGEEGYGADTFWLVDKSNHTVRPFESHMALDAAFGKDLETALQNVVTVAPPQIDSSGEITDGVLADFSLLGPEYAINEDGTSKSLDFSSHQLKGRYGKPIDEGMENNAAEILDGFLNKLKENENQTNIPGSFIGKLRKDQRLMAFYLSSLAYGDYTLNDVYSDILRRFKNKD